MKGNMTVTMDENFMIFMLKEVMNKSRMARGMKGIAYAIALPAAICCILMELMVWRLEGEFSISWILLLATSMLLFAFTVGGYKEFYLRRCRKELKKIQFPIQQIIEFDEDMFLFQTERISYNIPWKNMEQVCETENYWFLGPIVAAIDKNKLTREQYQFVSKKCKMIMEKEKSFRGC